MEFQNTKSAVRQRRADAQQREQQRIAARRAELEGTSIEVIRDSETRPLAEAKRALDENFKNLVRTLRSNLLEVPDEDFQHDYVPINTNDPGAVKTQNQLAYEGFKILHPEGSACPWYRSDQNVTAIQTYFGVNGVKVQTCEMLSRAWCKLSVHGLTEKPEAESRTPVVSTPSRPEQWDVKDYPWDSPESRPDDKIVGFDYRGTGERRYLTRYQVDQLSSEDFLKFTQFGRTSSAGTRNK